jgi:hypothetical protein
MEYVIYVEDVVLLLLNLPNSVILLLEFRDTLLLFWVLKLHSLYSLLKYNYNI